ncbi:uncharacterized protein LOC133873195 [Alnus glutinosa]|uniref:uncharacterized protein LOC133873195 n=1 Tax=Alnus glutinosa TaxID=3517 RepID=UPI002D785516|nr:uncharacterized protein LOC133873195 [Alnus glutinosa]
MLQAPPSGSKGGLLLAWKNDINFVSVCVSSNIISVWYYSVDPSVKCLFSFVYGPPYKKTDLDFWMALADFGNTYSIPWICLGDFNTISSSDDKLGGRPFDHFSFNPINEFMDSFGMVDLGFSSNPFTWSNHRQGSPSYCLAKKLKLTKSAIKQWNKLYFGDIKTKVFHTSTLIRRRRNSINLLQSPQGGWLSDRSAIGDCFITHFKLLFTSSHPSPNEELLSLFDPVISAEDNLHLGSLPTESEIFASLKSLGRTKAPGPDGFTALFYVKYWDYIKNTVLLAIGNFFQNNNLLREQNHTFIALIPKRLGASSVHHYRPISLCNIIYKIISKLLANRLKPLLSKVISPFQTAFVPGRHIQDNSILAHEMLHTLKSKRGNGGLMAVNIDMEKAFDRMEWSFIISILNTLGFNDKWINWIRLCITTTSFSVLLNGSPFGHFRPSRGLRQGDPLSPFLFIIGTEALSRLLHHHLRGFSVSRDNLAINHLLFADDLVIFTSATSSEASRIKICLDKYSLCSGQSINISKSNILFSKNTTASTISSIQGFLPFAITPVSAKHLGLPMLIGRSKKFAFSNILDKVKGKIEGWRSKTFSQAGKSVLIKGSYIWNDIKTIVPFLKFGACYISHSLSSLAIWFAPWIPTLPNFRPTPRVEGLQANFPLAILDLVSSSTGTWNFPLLEFLFDQASVSEILKIRTRFDTDSILWTPSLTGVFSTKSAHWFYTSQRTSVVSPLSQANWKLLWKLKINHRLHLFLWKMVWNILPTKERILSAIWTQSRSDSTCSLCSSSTDSLVHLFLSCPIARVVWRNSFWPLDILALRISSMAEWFNVILHPHRIGIPAPDSHFFQIFAAVACDQIWFARNKAHHENLIPNAMALSVKINRLSKEHYWAWKLKVTPVFPEWKRPLASSFKINFDTAIRDTFST